MCRVEAPAGAVHPEYGIGPEGEGSVYEIRTTMARGFP